MDKKDKIIGIIDDFLESYKETTVYLYDGKSTSTAVNEANNLTTLFKSDVETILSKDSSYDKITSIRNLSKIYAKCLQKLNPFTVVDVQGFSNVMEKEMR